MTRALTFCFIAASAAGTAVASSPVLIDRMAVIVGKKVIKTSDIERDLRVTDFLNRTQLTFGPPAERTAADRLIDQEVIRQEIVSGGFRRPADSAGRDLVDDLRRTRYGGSDTQLQEALAQYGLTENQLRDQLLWQVTVLRFIDERFPADGVVNDQEVHAYYDQHLNDLRRQYPQDFRFDTLAPKIRESLAAPRVNQQFEDWLKDARSRYRIEFKEDAFE